MAWNHSDFEWDDQKAQSNLLKHGVSFVEAAQALRQGEVWTHLDDRSAYDEFRLRTLAQNPFNGQMSLIVWTRRNGRTRVISSTAANQKERHG